MGGLEAAVEIARTHEVLGRMKCRGNDLSELWELVFVPTPGYVETGRAGPIPLCELEWLDFQTFTVTDVGRLVPKRIDDKSVAMTSALATAALEFVPYDGFVRVLAPSD